MVAWVFLYIDPLFYCTCTKGVYIYKKGSEDMIQGCATKIFLVLILEHQIWLSGAKAGGDSRPRLPATTAREDCDPQST